MLPTPPEQDISVFDLCLTTQHLVLGVVLPTPLERDIFRMLFVQRGKSFVLGVVPPTLPERDIFGVLAFVRKQKENNCYILRITSKYQKLLGKRRP